MPSAPIAETAPAQPDPGRGFREPLLAWYRVAARKLPWRETRDPYAVWVSEMMLQQTQVAAAEPFYLRWMERFPTLPDLAAADEGSVVAVWQGLGYYARARGLLRGAREVMRRFDGRLPTDLASLRSLPGIGPYTAGAVASLAFGVRTPAVDGNAVRVLTRRFGLRGDPGRQPLRRRIWELAASLLPDDGPGEFNAALMELGAVVCRPATPNCPACPVRTGCVARDCGLVHLLPETPARPRPTDVRVAALVPLRGGEVLLRRRSAGARRWAGMWEFPNVELAGGAAAAEVLDRLLPPGARVADGDLAPLGEIRHHVTRYRITLEVYRAGVEPASGSALPEDWCSRRPENTADLAMPAAHRRIVNLLLEWR